MSDNEKSDIEILREKNLEERNAFLSSFMSDPLFADAIRGINLANQEKNRSAPKPSTAITRKRRGDSTFKFTGSIPAERRSSARLRNKKPDYSQYDLPNERQITAEGDSIEYLEEVVFKVKKKRSFSRAASPRIIPVEEITDEMIKNIQTSGNKVYGAGGTSCHQCRQKTIDTKTVCRSGFCVGIRGQFCGICVINRYGEDPAQALKDPNWKCYVCRGCCNCSFCRLKEGKRPTGILAPMAKINGFKSVRDFLNSLKGYGDYADPEKDPENLLGFDGDVAVMGGNKRISLHCDFHGFKDGFSEDDDGSETLLGFDGRFAVLTGNKLILLTCSNDEALKQFL